MPLEAFEPFTDSHDLHTDHIKGVLPCFLIQQRRIGEQRLTFSFNARDGFEQLTQ